MTKVTALLALGFLSDAALSQFATSARIQGKKRATSVATFGPMPTGLDLQRVCTEGDNVKMGFNYSPSRWCYCGVWGPFATISGATTDYCKFTATPTATITLTDDSRLPTTTEDTACHIKTQTATRKGTVTAETICSCGNVEAGVMTRTADGFGTIEYLYCNGGDNRTISTQLSPPKLTSTSTSVSTSPPPESKPTAPYIDGPGQCQIHVKQDQVCIKDRSHDRRAEITVMDASEEHNQIGLSHWDWATADIKLNTTSLLEGVILATSTWNPDEMKFTFTRPGEDITWTSRNDVKNKAGTAYCKAGGWDPRHDPMNAEFVNMWTPIDCPYGAENEITVIRSRKMDCYFDCKWMGGKSTGDSGPKR